MALLLPSEQLSKIRVEAEFIYPRECCGVLIGIDGETRRVTEAVSVENEFNPSERHHRFSIPSRRMLELERVSAAKGEEILGFFHSHPDHEPVPSAFDLEYAWPFYSYVIVSVREGRSDVVRSWVLDEARGQFVEQAIETPDPNKRPRLGRGCS